MSFNCAKCDDAKLKETLAHLTSALSLWHSDMPGREDLESIVLRLAILIEDEQQVCPTAD